MFGIEPLARIVRHDARIEVKVPAAKGKKAYSYFREGGEGEKKSSGVGKKVALVGGGLALAGLGAAAIAMSRKKPSEQVAASSAKVSEPEKKTNNTVRNVAIGVGTAGLGAAAIAARRKEKSASSKGEGSISTSIHIKGGRDSSTPSFINFDDFVYHTRSGSTPEDGYFTVGNEKLEGAESILSYAGEGKTIMAYKKLSEDQKRDLSQKLGRSVKPSNVSSVYSSKGDDGLPVYVLQADILTEEVDYRGRSARNILTWKLPKGVSPESIPIDWAEKVSKHLGVNMNKDQGQDSGYGNTTKAYDSYKAKFNQGIPLL